MDQILAGSGAFYLFLSGIALFLVLVFVVGRASRQPPTIQRYGATMIKLRDIARKIAASYDPKLSDSAIITVNNGDLREMSEVLMLMDRVSKSWGGFKFPGTDQIDPRLL